MNKSFDQARNFIKDFRVKKNSFARKMCFLTFDLLIVVGLIYYSHLVYKDRQYWEKAPYAFNIFLLVQYVCVAAAMRVPVLECVRTRTINIIMAGVVLTLFVNTTIGIIQLNKFSKVDFNLKAVYIINGVILILAPISVLVFMIIVLVKLLCFFLADHSRRIRRND